MTTTKSHIAFLPAGTRLQRDCKGNARPLGLAFVTGIFVGHFITFAIYYFIILGP